MTNPKFSIITASYNYEEYIKETIESVIAQTYKDWEMIIVDDSSKDNSVEVIKTYCIKDSRIKLFQHEDSLNKGLPETIKLGIEKAQGEWLVFLESDDTIEPNYLKEKLKIINECPSVGFIFNDINMFGEEKKIQELKKYFNKINKQLSNIKFPAKMTKLFKKRNMIPTFSCVMAKKELFNNINWNCSIPKYIDYYLWTQIANNNKFYYLNKKLTNWRMHNGSYVNNKDSSKSKIKYFFKVEIQNNITSNRYKFWYQFLFKIYKFFHFIK